MARRLAGFVVVAALLSGMRAEPARSGPEGDGPDSTQWRKLAGDAQRTLTAARRPGPFLPGEDLLFDVHYGILPAGEAHLQVTRMVPGLSGGRAYELRSLAKSTGFFGKLYDVNDRVTSWLDSSSLQSVRIEKLLHEGSYHQEQEILFDVAAGLARYRSGDSVALSGPVQDDLSCFYLARCLDLRPDTVYYLETHSNKVTYPMQVRTYGREVLETPMGRYTCIKVEPRVDRGGLFKKQGRMFLWISDDAARLPVRMRTKLPIGAITADLVSVRRGLAP